MIYSLTDMESLTRQFLVSALTEKELLQKVEDMFGGIKATINTDSTITVTGLDTLPEIVEGLENNEIITVDEPYVFNDKATFLLKYRVIQNMEEIAELVVDGVCLEPCTEE